MTRNIVVCVVLSIITCDIYGLYWAYTLNEYARAVAPDEWKTSGITVILLSIITCGIYGLYWAWTMGDKLDAARGDHGVAPGSFPIIFLVLNLFGFSLVTLALMQHELNKYTPNF